MTRPTLSRLSKPAHPLSAGGVLAAVMLATATGSGLTTLLFAGGALLSPSGGGVAMAVSGLPLVFFFACPVWLAGLTVIGGPCWWILHRSGVRSRWTAPLVGALLTLSVAGGYVALSPSDADSIEAWTFVAGLTAIGAVAGRVLAKVAYPKGTVQ
jgi:hypothetical protein